MAATGREEPPPQKMTQLEYTMRMNTNFPPDVHVPPAVIHGLFFVKTVPPQDKLWDYFITQLCGNFVRFRSVACEDGTWQPLDPATLDRGYHLLSEPAVGSHAELQLTVDRLAGGALDMRRPLWRFHVVPCTYDGALQVLLLRVHHSIADGFHLNKVILSITTRRDGSQFDAEENARKYEEMMRKVSACKRWAAKLLFSIPAALSNAAASKKKLSAAAWHPPEEVRTAGSYGPSRRCVLVPPFSLEFIKDLKSRAGASVNDVLMGAAAGAARRYCERRGDPLFRPGEAAPAAKFNALVPVALPKPFPSGVRADDRVVNNFCFCSAQLAVGPATPLERVMATKREMDGLKKSRKPRVGLWMVNQMAKLLPMQVTQSAAKDLFGAHSMVFSNVPGPSETLFILGEEVHGVQGVFYNLIPQFILVSYRGKVWMNFVVDPDVITDPEVFTECFFEELRALATEVGSVLELGTGDGQAGAN